MDRVIGNALSTLDEMEATIAVAREKLHVLNYIMYSDPTLRDLKRETLQRAVLRGNRPIGV